MGKLNKDTQGFSVVELLLVIIIIILIGFVGWYVYHTDHKTTTATTSTKTSVKPPSTSTGSSSSLQTYTSTLGGFSLKYPSDWNLDGFQGVSLSPVSGSQLNGTETEIRIESKQEKQPNGFGLTVTLSKSAPTATPYNTYGNGTTTVLTNNITLWQEKLQENFATGPSTDTCPQIQIGTDDTYSMLLSNGEYMTVNGSFCYGQGQTTTYSYLQQINSPEWTDAINIIKSINLQ